MVINNCRALLLTAGTLLLLKVSALDLDPLEPKREANSTSKGQSKDCQRFHGHTPATATKPIKTVVIMNTQEDSNQPVWP
jgi:hypothetical protein